MNSIWSLTIQRIVGLTIICAAYYGITQFTGLQLDYWRTLPILMASYATSEIVNSFLRKKK